MEHGIVIPNGFIQKIAAALIQTIGIFGIFFAQYTVGFHSFIGGVTENRRDAELFRWIGCHLTLEFIVIQTRHRNGCDGKDGVKAAQPLRLLHLLDLAARGGSNVADVGQGVEHIGFIAAIGLLIEVIEDILCDF